MGYSHEIQPFIQQAFWNPVNTSLYSMVIELQPLQGCWPTKNCIITDSYDTTNWSCESADRDYFQSLSNSREFELHSFHTFLFQCVIHHPRTPTCGHFIALSQYWEMVESCLESTSGFINITIVWYTHCAHPQIPGVSRVDRFPLTSIYSEYFEGLQSCSKYKVFYYSLRAGSASPQASSVACQEFQKKVA